MIQLVVTAIITVLVTIFRGALAVVGFFVKVVSSALRLALSVLPISVLGLFVTAALLVIRAVSGDNLVPENPVWHPDGAPYLQAVGSLILLTGQLRASYPNVIGIIILIAAVILCIPVLLCLTIAHAFIQLMPVIPILLGADAAFYAVYGVIARKGPFKQIADRYYFLFPKSAARHDERAYHAWLRRHADEFRQDTWGRPADDIDVPPVSRKALRRSEERRRIEEYYDEPFEDDGYDGYDEGGAYDDEDAYDGYDDYDREETIEEAADEDFEETWEEPVRRRRASFFSFEDEKKSEKRKSRAPEAEAPRSSFDFFAGCNDRDSIERKYRSLAKLYHPDNQDGDTAALQEINRQRTEALKKL